MIKSRYADIVHQPQEVKMEAVLTALITTSSLSTKDWHMYVQIVALHLADIFIRAGGTGFR